MDAENKRSGTDDFPTHLTATVSNKVKTQFRSDCLTISTSNPEQFHLSSQRVLHDQRTYNNTSNACDSVFRRRVIVSLPSVVARV
jgi:hypothetical protein